MEAAPASLDYYREPPPNFLDNDPNRGALPKQQQLQMMYSALQDPLLASMGGAALRAWD